MRGVIRKFDAPEIELSVGFIFGWDLLTKVELQIPVPTGRGRSSLDAHASSFMLWKLNGRQEREGNTRNLIDTHGAAVLGR